ncbi:MAG: hypothetical protein E6370_13940 [Clostridiales bacterium]|jgi:hypothetical protein|nr:hypothetical protein [Clostridiales bacterium]
MDNIREIALSKIADILSSSNLIIPQVDIWKKIFNNAGLSDYYENRSPQFTTKIEAYGYRDDERNLYHNEKCYNGLYETFKELEYSQEKFLKLCNSIAAKLSLYNLFSEEAEKATKNMYIDEYIEKVDVAKKNQLLNEYPSKSFQELQNNMNMLGLNIMFSDDGLSAMPFTDSLGESSFDNNVLLQWLSGKYSNISTEYIDAVKAYSVGDGTACITHCRSVITGVFSYKKIEQRKWLDGLRTVCNKDKNILNVEINKIHKYDYNANSSDSNARYQYPRYNLIYKLYSFTCALGAHITEGNVNGENIDFETATLEDAFMALRMTESVLIWLYQTNALE